MTTTPIQALREERKKLFGAKPSKTQIILACQGLLSDIGEYKRSFKEEELQQVEDADLLDTVEDLLHEMAHHVALTGNVEFGSTRSSSVSRAIEDLLPAQRAGNEIDALAIEMNALWWLHIPLSKKKIFKILPSDFDLDISRSSIMRMVQSLREVYPITELGRGLAWVVYEEIEIQKREAHATSSAKLSSRRSRNQDSKRAA